MRFYDCFAFGPSPFGLSGCLASRFTFLDIDYLAVRRTRNSAFCHQSLIAPLPSVVDASETCHSCSISRTARPSSDGFAANVFACVQHTTLGSAAARSSREARMSGGSPARGLQGSERIGPRGTTRPRNCRGPRDASTLKTWSHEDAIDARHAVTSASSGKTPRSSSTSRRATPSAASRLNWRRF